MADLWETGLSAGGGSIIGAIVAYMGLEKRVKKLEDADFITKDGCTKCSEHAAEWREEIRSKLDMLLEIHLKRGAE